MVIYEVNLSIDKDVLAEYQVWLKKHIKDMLQFPGFIQANILKQVIDSSSPQQKITVQYQLESREALNEYLSKFAPKMREEGIRLFKDRFQAERRIFELQGIFLR